MDAGSTVLRPRAGGNRRNTKSHWNACSRESLNSVCSAHSLAPHCTFFIFLIFDQTRMSTVQYHKNSQKRRFNVENGIRAWTCKDNSSPFLFEFVMSGIELRFHEWQVSAFFVTKPGLQALASKIHGRKTCVCLLLHGHCCCPFILRQWHLSATDPWHSIYPPRAA